MIRKKLAFIALFSLAACCHEVTNERSDYVGNNAPRDKEIVKTLAVAGDEVSVVHFDYNSTALNDEGKKILDQKVIAALKSDKTTRIVVEGHCDERGSDASNLALGTQRAKATKAYLVKNGVKSSRISVKSFGETKPLDNDHDEDAWAKNRRVVTIFVDKK